ncbi:hypothetical protein [Nocardioides lijunqiniae]|uniref:hypothetical protein n=1 Tax=Nocardioides lijunqiniae TaxID=2760832 RepID=UPI001877839E|nr:hypothetical protein [Nocardioides lijunqiniae]
MTAADAAQRLADLTDPHAGCIPRFCRAGNNSGVARCDDPADRTATPPAERALTDAERESLAKDIQRRFHRGGIQTNETGLTATIRCALDAFDSLLAAHDTEAGEQP